MQLLGHKDIRMTLRYIQVTQLDLQREFHAARRNAENLHRLPVLAGSGATSTVGPSGIRHAIATVVHLIEMYRREIDEPKNRAKLQRLQWRLLSIRTEVDNLSIPEK